MTHDYYEKVFTRYIRVRDLKKYEEDWNSLFDANPDLSPYQSFRFNTIAQRFSPFSPRRILLEPIFFLFYNSKGVCRLIAPLYKGRGWKKHTVRLFTDGMPAGYSDFIYPADLSLEEFGTAIEIINRELKSPTFLFNKINETSRLNAFLQEGDFNLMKVDRSLCYQIPLEDSFASYWQRLSKNTRQNIRTSKNKLMRERYTWEIELHQDKGLSRHIQKRIMPIYIKRYFEREGRSLRMVLLALSKRFLNPITWALKTSEHSFCAILSINKKPAAFLAGFARDNGRLVIPMLAIDSDWEKFSPGGILITELMEKLHELKGYTSLDLSRGGEAYKKRYGGIQHYNFSYEFTLEDR